VITPKKRTLVERVRSPLCAKRETDALQQTVIEVASCLTRCATRPARYVFTQSRNGPGKVATLPRVARGFAVLCEGRAAGNCRRVGAGTSK
jgi:hypothetical protein